MKVLRCCLRWGALALDATHDDAALVVEGGGEEVGVAAVGELEALAQHFGALREVAHGEVGFLDLGGEALEFIFAESIGAYDLEDAAGELGDEGVGGVEVGVGMELLESPALGGEAEAAGFHEGAVGLVEVAPDGGGIGELGGSLIGGGVVEGLHGGTVEIDGVDGGLVGGGGIEDEEEFLALVADGHDVYLADAAELAQGLGDIEHGGALDHDVRGLVQQLGLEVADIGFAVGQGNDFVAYAVAAGGVDKEPVVRGKGVEEFGAVAMEHGDGLAEEGEVVGGDAAELFVALDVGGGGKAVGQVAAVDAEASGEVGEALALDERCLVAGCDLGGALLHGEAHGVDEAFGGGPGGELGGGDAATFDLGGGHAHVDLWVAGCLQGKGAHVVGGVLADEGLGVGVDHGCVAYRQRS